MKKNLIKFVLLKTNCLTLHQFLRENIIDREVLYKFYRFNYLENEKVSIVRCCYRCFKFSIL